MQFSNDGSQSRSWADAGGEARGQRRSAKQKATAKQLLAIIATDVEQPLQVSILRVLSFGYEASVFVDIVP